MASEAGGSRSGERGSLVRAFVAIMLPDDVRGYCLDVMTRLRQALGPAERALRWVDPEGIHVTLKFLGNVRTIQLSDLTERLASELVDQAPFDLGIGSLNAFPNPRAPRVALLQVAGDLRQLGNAQARVEAATEPLGFSREKRPYRPHLTLGRVRENASPADLAALARALSGLSDSVQRAPAFRVTSASLMQSHLGPGGAKYTPLRAFRLKGR